MWGAGKKCAEGRVVSGDGLGDSFGGSGEFCDGGNLVLDAWNRLGRNGEGDEPTRGVLRSVPAVQIDGGARRDAEVRVVDEVMCAAKECGKRYGLQRAVWAR